MSRQKYADARERVVKDLEKDLIGPALGEREILKEYPNVRYIIGILHPRDTEVSGESIHEEDTDISL